MSTASLHNDVVMDVCQESKYITPLYTILQLLHHLPSFINFVHSVHLKFKFRLIKAIWVSQFKMEYCEIYKNATNN